MNSLMLHGMIFARYASAWATIPATIFLTKCIATSAPARSCRRCTSRLRCSRQQNWDVLAEAAKWSRDNAQTLKDSHWIGGDPARLEVYGWASWSPEKAIMTLRNPSDQPQDFTASLTTLLELPAGSAPAYTARSPWKSDSGQAGRDYSCERATHISPATISGVDAGIGAVKVALYGGE